MILSRSLKPHEYVDVRCQGSMQRKRDKYALCIFYDITKSKTQAIDILDFKYCMVVQEVVFEVTHT